MIPLVSLRQPTRSDQITEKDGVVSAFMAEWMRVIFDRTGDGSGVPFQLLVLDAAGTDQGSATDCTVDFTIVRGGSGGVRLHDTLQPAQYQFVYNFMGGPLNVYPPSGGQIDALGIDAPYSLANTKAQMYLCESVSPMQLLSLQLG